MRLAGIGAYAPRFRLPTETVRATLDSFHAPGIESVAIPAADEDPVTMAWEAGRRALGVADVDPSTLDGLFLASTTLPVQDESPIPHLATAYGAPEDIDTRVFAGSGAAGGDAFASALDTDASGPVLVIASDATSGAPDSPEGHAAGAGAAAIVLAADGPGSVTARAAATTAYPGTRYRPLDGNTRGLGITTYDRTAYTETLRTALDGLDATEVADSGVADSGTADFDVSDVGAVAMTMPDGKLPYRAAGAVGIDTSTVANAETVSALGDTGCAGPLLGLARAVESGAGRILVTASGSGSTMQAFTIDTGETPVDAALDGRVELDYAGAMRRRGYFSTGAPAGGGANVPTPTYQQSIPQRYRLTAGSCQVCGELVFPPQNACPACSATAGYETVELARDGVVTASTVIGTGGAPPEFVDHQNRSGAYGTAIIEFSDADGRTVDIPLQVVLTETGESPAIGDRVTTVFRVLYEQQGERRYAVKARPTTNEDG